MRDTKRHGILQRMAQRHEWPEILSDKKKEKAKIEEAVPKNSMYIYLLYVYIVYMYI